MPQTIQQISVPHPTAIGVRIPARSAMIAGASGVAMIAASFFAYQAYAGSARAAASVMPGSDLLGAHGIMASTPNETHQMTIGNNGIVYVQNATLASISGTIATIESTWGSTNFSWRGEITNQTKILHSDGSPAQISDLSVGQMVTVTGLIDTQSAEPAIQIQFLRE